MDQEHVIVQFPLALAAPVQDRAAPDEDADTWGFTYIPPEQRALVGKATQAIQTGMANIAQNLFEIGRHLTIVKQILEHGHFRMWIKHEFGLEERTAQRLMNVYRRLGTKANLVRQVKPTALYYLAMPSTPEAAIALVEKLVKEGKRLSVQQILAIIAACKQPTPRVEETVPARLAQAVRKAGTALSYQTIADCEQLLGAEAATRLEELRRELDDLLEQVQSRRPSARRSAAQAWTVVSAAASAAPAQAVGAADAVPTLPGAETVQTPDGSVAASERIVPGCTVYVREVDTGREVHYTLVAHEPGRPEEGHISWQSPVAQALRDKRVGEIATAQTPGGPIQLAITGIRFPDGRLAGSTAE